MTIHAEYVQDPSEERRELFVLFAACVAGKPADVVSRKLHAMLEEWGPAGFSPFEKVQRLDEIGALSEALKSVSMGQYIRLERALPALASYDWSEPDLASLMEIPGVGPKTARYILMYGYNDRTVAALDTHILKFLAEVGVGGVPKSTPAEGAQYAQLENAFLRFSSHLEAAPLAVDDLVWRYHAREEDSAAYHAVVRVCQLLLGSDAWAA